MSAGSIDFGVLVGLIVAALEVHASEPVEHQGLPGGAEPVADIFISFPTASTSTPTWFKRASAICVAIVRCQTDRVEPELVAVEHARHPARSGARSWAARPQ